MQLDFALTDRIALLLSIRMDPTDWREIDGLAMAKNRLGMCTTDRTPCTSLWFKSHVNAPQTELKAKLYRLRTRIAVDPSDAEIASVCREYDTLAVNHSDNALALNNGAICRVYDQQFSAGIAMFAQALAVQMVSDTDRGKIVSNLARLNQWGQQMGAEHPALLDGAAKYVGDGLMLLY